MKHIKLSRSLSQAVRKYKPLREDINLFKEKLTDCLNHIAIAEENKEHEENFKKYIADFLKESLYQEHLINTKERIDLAIYSGKDANSHISVLIEVKRPSNTNEFLSAKSINKKALHELLLYYLQERVDKKNK
jgi:adenine-specific DNA-methyltransferase